MAWTEQLVAGLRSAMDKPDVAWSGIGTYVASVLLGLAGAVALWFFARLFKKQTSSDQHDANKWFVENRHKLLDRLQWELDERKKSLLLGQTTLHLDKDLSPDEVYHPYTRQDSICCTLERDEKTVETTEQPIVDLFLRPDVGQRLAILGKPGSGKTVCLLKHLLQQAEGDAHEPLPIIFECSEWDGRELVPWMAWQLHRKYEFEEDTARQMVQSRDILPLFDGLDELATEKQGDFVRCFNALPNDRPQIVCCRIKEYEYLQENAGDKLALRNAVILRDITPQRLKEHLLRAGLDDLWTLLEQSENEADPSSPQPAEEEQDTEQPQTLPELARRPLFLGIMIAVAEKLRQGWKRQQGESWEDLLWRLYLNDCLAQRPPQPKPDAHDRKYAKAPSRHWLHCLAKWIQAENKVALQIDELQPSMLKQYWRFGLLYGLVLGLACGLIGWVFAGLRVGSATGVIVGIIIGLFIGHADRLHPKEDTEIFVVGAAMPLACLGVLVYTLVRAENRELGQLLAVMLIVGLFAALFNSLLEEVKSINSQVGKSIHLKKLLCDVLRNSLLLFPILTFVSMIIFSLLMLIAKQIGFDVDYFFEANGFYLVSFGTAVSSFFVLSINLALQHYLLRFCLWEEGQLPLHLVPWLDAMHQRKVFQRVGGSYHFLHKQLQEYLAKQQAL